MQLLARRVPDFQLGFLRFLTGTLLGGGILYVRKESPQIPRELWIMTVIMGLCCNWCNLLFFFSISILPLSHVSGFEIVITMVTVVVISRVILCERQSPLTLLANVLCTMGLCLLLQPWADFTDGFTPTFVQQQSNRSTTAANSLTAQTAGSYAFIGYSSLIVSGIVLGVYSILNGIYLKSVKPTVLFFLTSAIPTPIALLLCLYFEEPVRITDPYVILYIIIHVLCTGISVFARIIACQMIGPVHVSIIENSTTLFNLIPQYTLFKHDLYGRMNVMEVLGCLVITISITLGGLVNYDETHEDFT